MFKDLLVEEKLNVKLCAKLYHNGNTALDEAFGIGTVNKYLNSLIKKIEQLRAKNEVDENTVAVAFNSENERIIDSFTSTPSATTFYLGLPAISITEVNQFLKGKFTVEDIENVRLLNQKNKKLIRTLTLRDYIAPYNGGQFKYLIVFKIDKNTSVAKRYDIANTIFDMPRKANEVYQYFNAQKRIIVDGGLVGVLNLKERTDFEKAIIYPDLLDENDVSEFVDEIENFEGSEQAFNNHAGQLLGGAMFGSDNNTPRIGNNNQSSQNNQNNQNNNNQNNQNQDNSNKSQNNQNTSKNNKSMSDTDKEIAELGKNIINNNIPDDDDDEDEDTNKKELQNRYNKNKVTHDEKSTFNKSEKFEEVFEELTDILTSSFILPDKEYTNDTAAGGGASGKYKYEFLNFITNYKFGKDIDCSKYKNDIDEKVEHFFRITLPKFIIDDFVANVITEYSSKAVKDIVDNKQTESNTEEEGDKQ